MNSSIFFDWDCNTHMQHAVTDPKTGCLSCDVPRITEDGIAEMGAARGERCGGNIEWCDSLYAADWYELYGIHIDSRSTGLGVDHILSDDEIQAYMGINDEYFQDMSESRKAFIK